MEDVKTWIPVDSRVRLCAEKGAYLRIDPLCKPVCGCSHCIRIENRGRVRPRRRRPHSCRAAQLLPENGHSCQHSLPKIESDHPRHIRAPVLTSVWNQRPGAGASARIPQITRWRRTQVFAPAIHRAREMGCGTAVVPVPSAEVSAGEDAGDGSEVSCPCTADLRRRGRRRRRLLRKKIGEGGATAQAHCASAARTATIAESRNCFPPLFVMVQGPDVPVPGRWSVQ